MTAPQSPGPARPALPKGLGRAYSPWYSPWSESSLSLRLLRSPVSEAPSQKPRLRSPVPRYVLVTRLAARLRSALQVGIRPFRPAGATRREGAARLAASPPRDWQLGGGRAARGERRRAGAAHPGARDEGEGGGSARAAGAGRESSSRERSVAGGRRGRGLGRRARLAKAAFGADQATPSSDHPRQPEGAGRHPEHAPRHGQSAPTPRSSPP